MNIKKLTALLCAVVMVLSLAACGGSGDKASDSKHYTIGICQLCLLYTSPSPRD